MYICIYVYTRMYAHIYIYTHYIYYSSCHPTPADRNSQGVARCRTQNDGGLADGNKQSRGVIQLMIQVLHVFIYQTPGVLVAEYVYIYIYVYWVMQDFYFYHQQYSTLFACGK